MANPPPIEALGPTAPDPYPVDVLPGWARRHVESVTEACQVPSDLPFLLSLTALSVALANKARVKVREGYTEPAHLWTAAVLPPGSRKSPVFEHMTSPLRAWERERVEKALPEYRRQLDQKKVAEKTLRKARQAAANSEAGKEAGQSRDRVQEARQQLEEIDVQAVPRLIASDVTSEELAKLMAENEGKIAVLAPEGDIFRIMAGRYSGGVNFDHYKRAWTGGEAIRDDRVGREGTHVPRPALTLGLTLQPSVLDTLEEKESFRGEGLLARFLYAMPDPGIGNRRTGTDVPGLEREAEKEYRRNLYALLDSDPKDTDSDGMAVPHELTLSSAGTEAWDEFAADVEEMLGPGGRLEHHRDWGGKLVGHTIRAAVLLHAAERIGEGRAPWGAPVCGEAMRGAVRVGRAAIGHTLRVFDRLERDPETELARYLYRRLSALDAEERTVREVHRACQGKAELESVEDIRRVLSTLETHDLVQLDHSENTGRGRPSSPKIVLHPDTTSTVDRNDRTGGKAPEEGDSVNSVNTERGDDREESANDVPWEVF